MIITLTNCGISAIFTIARSANQIDVPFWHKTLLRRHSNGLKQVNYTIIRIEIYPKMGSRFFFSVPSPKKALKCATREHYISGIYTSISVGIFRSFLSIGMTLTVKFGTRKCILPDFQFPLYG